MGKSSSVLTTLESPSGQKSARRAAKLNSNHNESFDAEVLEAMLAFRRGDFPVRLPINWTGVQGKIADAFNDILAMSEQRTQEAARVCRVVGREGRLRQRMAVSGLSRRLGR